MYGPEILHLKYYPITVVQLSQDWARLNKYYSDIDWTLNRASFDIA